MAHERPTKARYCVLVPWMGPGLECANLRSMLVFATSMLRMDPTLTCSIFMHVDLGMSAHSAANHSDHLSIATRVHQYTRGLSTALRDRMELYTGGRPFGDENLIVTRPYDLGRDLVADFGHFLQRQMSRGPPRHFIVGSHHHARIIYRLLTS